MDQIEGRNPVIEALRAGREINKLLVARGSKAGSMKAILALARSAGVPVQEVDREKLDGMAAGRAHQGVIALGASKEYASVEDMLALAAERGEDPFLLILDGIEDPQNLGSLLRTADAAGVHGVIIPQHRAAGLTAVVAKASAGAIEYVPVARVVNLSRTIDELKEKGIWVAGSDASAEQLHFSADLKGPLAIVVGSEGKGMGRLVKEKCDFLVQLPMRGHVSSLNAAVAGAILVYEALRQRMANGVHRQREL